MRGESFTTALNVITRSGSELFEQKDTLAHLRELCKELIDKSCILGASQFSEKRQVQYLEFGQRLLIRPISGSGLIGQGYQLIGYTPHCRHYHHQLFLPAGALYDAPRLSYRLCTPYGGASKL